MTIKPHGGKLIDRVLTGTKKEKALEKSYELRTIEIDVDLLKDVTNIATGVFSPLEGFMTQDDYESVLKNKRLSNNLPWTIPIVLDVTNDVGAEIIAGDEICLTYEGTPVAILYVDDKYIFNKRVLAEAVFATTDREHPGVAKAYSMKDMLIGGKIDLIEKINSPYYEYALSPVETRALFKEKGWETIVGFQTRNVPHLGHEYVQKAALTFTDGLFINPVIGKKKSGDFRDDVILDSYKVAIDNYFPKDRVVMSIFETEMRYAGPREAIFHAIVRQNFGCTHFIVGRDHAGVGSFYSPFAAHEIFKEFPDLDIKPMFFRSFSYCKKCASIVNDKICPHGDDMQIQFSGTRMRDLIVAGREPPADSMRHEVALEILKYKNPFVA